MQLRHVLAVLTQVEIIRSFTAKQPDELSLQVADVVLIHQQVGDGKSEWVWVTTTAGFSWGSQIGSACGSWSPHLASGYWLFQFPNANSVSLE